MRPAERIKKFIANVPLETLDQRDKEVLDDVFNALERSKKARSAASQPNMWRIIMKSRITRIAAAAVIVVAVMIVIQQFGVPIDVTNVAWADVQKAFLAQPWIHLKYDNGTESWYNLKTGDHCHKQL